MNCLSSKVVSSNFDILAPIAIEAVLRIIDKENDTNVNLRNIKISIKIGGTVDDSELIYGLVFCNNKVSHFVVGPSRVDGARIALI